MTVTETVMKTGNGRLMLYEVEICRICRGRVTQPRLIAHPAAEPKDKDCNRGGLSWPDSQMLSGSNCVLVTT